ncbi:hypothetical protein EDC39_10862 [Geothermobacter ehrlichii]|uniref:Uncharacterized protein n=1 Tax=Geothermobacter ehrlichii TaxID=213224 RepID=A0A5D3WIX2_9BACT|nr:hypothetical protein [Geothermobacter ehrlichii]TYO98125.1 hypothetical protein EDC39_10862 [Geothermobacter ehrlichii]
MSEQRLATEAMAATLHLGNGEVLRGELFLQMVSSRHGGRQRVGELLNDEECFIPVRTPTQVVLVNLDRVVSVTVARSEQEEGMLTLGEHHRVRFILGDGRSLVADIFVNLPESRGRVKDFLNQKVRFLTCLQPDRVIYVNPAFLQLVDD